MSEVPYAPVSRGFAASGDRTSRPEHRARGRATMGHMTAGAPRLVIGEEELLVARGVAAAIAQAKADDPDALAEEFQAGEMTASDLYAAVSPSLFGGTRV